MKDQFKNLFKDKDSRRIIIYVFSVFILIALSTLVIYLNRYFRLHIYFLFISESVALTLLFLPLTILLGFAFLSFVPSSISELFWHFKHKMTHPKDKSTKRPSLFLTIIITLLTISFTFFSLVSSKMLISTILDFQYLKKPYVIELRDARIVTEYHTRKKLMLGRSQYILGTDAEGDTRKFFIGDGFKMLGSMEKVKVEYLPYTEMVINFENQ